MDNRFLVAIQVTRKILSSCNRLILQFFLSNLPFCSGGPLLRRDDNTLIGVAAYVKLNRDDWENHSKFNVELQAFTRIHFYFDWIARITGIELPICERDYAYRLY